MFSNLARSFNRQIYEFKSWVATKATHQPALNPTPEMKTAIEFSQQMGEADPLLFGGSIRDVVLGLPPKDYDIQCGLLGLEFDPDIETKLKERAERLGATVKKTSVTADIFEGITVSMMVEYKGLIVDLKMSQNYSRHAAFILQGRDAPINTVAMDKDGRFYADPLFENHALHKIYAVASKTPLNQERFENLSRKICGLCFITQDALDPTHATASEKRPFIARAAGFLSKHLP